MYHLWQVSFLPKMFYFVPFYIYILKFLYIYVEFNSQLLTFVTHMICFEQM